MTKRSPDEKIMKPYLRRMLREHRALNRWVGAAAAGQLCGLARPFETISVGMIGLALANAIEFGVSF